MFNCLFQTFSPAEQCSAQLKPVSFTWLSVSHAVDRFKNRSQAQVQAQDSWWTNSSHGSLGSTLSLWTPLHEPSTHYQPCSILLGEELTVVNWSGQNCTKLSLSSAVAAQWQWQWKAHYHAKSKINSQLYTLWIEYLLYSLSLNPNIGACPVYCCVYLSICHKFYIWLQTAITPTIF